MALMLESCNDIFDLIQNINKLSFLFVGEWNQAEGSDQVFDVFLLARFEIASGSSRMLLILFMNINRTNLTLEFTEHF